MSRAGVCGQSDLLRALLAPDAGAARAAAVRWLDGVDLNVLDAISTRLLPQLYLRLRTLGIAHAEMGRLRGIYRFHWYRNRLLLRALRPLLERCAAGDAPCALIGGLAVAARHCGDVGAREVPVAEMLIDENQLADALSELDAAGWTGEDRSAVTPAFVATRASMLLRSRDGFALALRWRTFDWDLSPRSVVDVRRHSRPADIEGVTLRLLDPTPSLLLTCAVDPVHPAPALAWIADAAAILAGGDIDWQRFVHDARAAGRGPNAARGLVTLAAYGLPVPADVVIALRRGFDRDRAIAALYRRGPGLCRFLYRAARLMCRARTASGGTLRYVRDLRRQRKGGRPRG